MIHIANVVCYIENKVCVMPVDTGTLNIINTILVIK